MFKQLESYTYSNAFKQFFECTHGLFIHFITGNSKNLRSINRGL